ncbi:hypothetical protein [uncultured Methanobrevibacter sp.]|uniref:hypothetical protein n=1 Tax=uncultured Methanobrevibacter sp. TaxID=253161 RepID=UPI0026250CB9|nr:hypothetical protein [uncultured Methanobrevibacter sp.]
MNSKSLELIEDVITPFGIWDSLEIVQDSIYLEFSDVELGNPKYDDSLNLSFRFSDKSFIVFFYNNIWDADFLANFDFKNHFINEDFVLKVKKIKFLDFEYLNTFFYNYAKNKVISLDETFDIHNIRNDFFVLLETEELAIAMGGDKMDFFFNDEKLDDDTLKKASNQWVLYFLKYRLKRNIVMKDPMCEHNTLI